MARPYLGGSPAMIETLDGESSATKTITLADSGKVFIMKNETTANSELVISLPAASSCKGHYFTFVQDTVGTTDTEDISINVNGTDDFVGHIVGKTGADNGMTAAASNVKIVFDQSNTPVPGDWVKIVSTGVHWYVTGVRNAANCVKFSD